MYGRPDLRRCQPTLRSLFNESLHILVEVSVETPAFSHAQMRAHTHDVQTPLPLTPTTKTVVEVPPSVKQKVTWKDALFPRVVPTRVQCIPQ